MCFEKIPPLLCKAKSVYVLFGEGTVHLEGLCNASLSQSWNTPTLTPDALHLAGTLLCKF